MTGRGPEVATLTFESNSPLKDVVINPDNKLAMLKEPLPEISAKATAALAYGWETDEEQPLEVFEAVKSEKITKASFWYYLGADLYYGEHYAYALECFEKALQLGTSKAMKFVTPVWIGVIKDITGKREEALQYYREALKNDTGESYNYRSFKIFINRQWIEDRLKQPFVRPAK